MAKAEIILVDKNDNEIGVAPKMEVHRQGKLHRAFSVFIFNSKGELLLQKRASTKYHSPGLWTNTCCSHPRPNKDLVKEARQRLKQEMGIDCPLKEVFSFVFRAQLGDLTEHEYDHVLLGRFEAAPKPDKDEVEDWKWLSRKELEKDIEANPQKYTYWFKRILPEVLKSSSG